MGAHVSMAVVEAGPRPGSRPTSADLPNIFVTNAVNLGDFAVIAPGPAPATAAPSPVGATGETNPTGSIEASPTATAHSAPFVP